MNMFTLLLFTTHMVSLGLAQVMITNGPMDTALCSGRTVNISCGFIGTNPIVAFPDWRIIRRSDDGSVTSNMTISGSDIIRNNVDDLQWVPDLTTGVNNAPNSYLIVGPVNETYNWSSYQCFITTIDDTFVSTIGRLTVAGPPSPFRNITTASSGCLSTTVSWDPVTGDPVCGLVSYDVMISPSDGIMMMRITDTSYNFTGLISDNSYTVTVAGINSAGVGESTARMVSVAGIPAVTNLMVTDNCLYVNASWTTITGPCSNSVQYMITLSSSSDTIGPVVTSNTSHTFKNTVMLIGDISVSVVAFIGNTMGTSIQVATQPSLTSTDRPQITTPIVVERCVSYLYITWNDTTQCIPVNYTVMLTNTSPGELLHSDTTSSNSYNFTGLTSDTLYSITITGRNRVGQDVVMNHTSSLKSEIPPMVIGVTPSSITTTRQQVEDITISWMEPLILNPCTTSLISSYEVQINYTNNDGRSTDSRSIPGTISSILMSDYFPGHPLSNTTYNISVIAVNEGGRGIANTPTCDCGSSDDDDLSTGAVVAISIVVTFIITLVVTAVMTYVITRMYYKRQLEKISRRNNNKNSDTQDNSQFVLMGRDVKMDTNPSYAIMDKDAIKMDTNPAYAVTK